MTQAQAHELFEGPRVDMANLFANTANLFLVAIFYSTLAPILIPIAAIGMTYGYWIEKFMLLRVHRVPEQMSGFMTIFISNLLPYFALIWSLAYVLLYREMMEYHYGKQEAKKLIVPLATIGVVIVYILFPIRSAINKCLQD